MKPLNKFILAALLCSASVNVYAGATADPSASVDSAFNSLMNSVSITSSSPGHFNNGARDIYSGGSMRMRFSRGTVNLISITPPFFSAGCSGVDMTFGGFSFIDGSKIQEFINQIMANSSGLVIQQGIRWFCPICADVLATMQDLSQMASSISLDSCRAAQKLVSAIFGKLNPDGNTSQRAAKSMCSTEYSGSGASNGFLSAFENGCSTVKDSISKLNDWINGQGDQNSAAAKYASMVGNKTWMTLTDMGFQSTYVKELFMTMNGYTSHFISGGNVTSAGSSGLWGDRGKILIDLLLYGYDPYGFQLDPNYKKDDWLIQAYNNAADEISGKPYILCFNSDGTRTTGVTPPNVNGVFKMCDAPKRVKISDLGTSPYTTPLITKYGLLANVHEQLIGASGNIANGNRLTKEQVQIIQLSPLPVYKMLNIAAVYPEVANALIGEYSKVIAVLIAEGIVNAWFNAPGSISASGSTHAELQQAKREARKVFNAVAEMMEKSQKTLNTTYQVQEEMMAQLNNIHRAITREAAYSSSIGTLAFGQMVARGVAQGH